MCGIVVSLTPTNPTRVGTVAAMCQAMRHRGPDDEGYLVVDSRESRALGGFDTPAAVMEAETGWRPRGSVGEYSAREAGLILGHRRLAVVDLSPAGHQPMQRDDLWAVYNGEIYNYIELRAELEQLGHRFATRSDTEVLLAAYAEWQSDCLSRFNGMWSIAIVDLRRRKLFIARDRFGVKPLYVWQSGGGELLLASEIKALLVHPRVRVAASLERCVDFARRGPQAWNESTEFEDIRRFPAGHWAEVSIDAPGRLEPIVFWQYPRAAPGQERHRFDRARSEVLKRAYSELLGDAVHIRMRSDVRIGTALSGGLDSSSIASFVNQELRGQGATQRQEVFSSVYSGPAERGCDESRFIELAARQLDVRSNRIEPRPADVPVAHEHMVWALDTPAPNTLMSSWHTFRLVADRGIVVTLDGQGADEQLAGYAGYSRNLLVHLPPLSALREALAIALRMQGFWSHLGIGLGGMLLRNLGGGSMLGAAVRRLHMGSDPTLTLSQTLEYDFVGNLKNLLLYADKTAMAWSIESRMPFMDYRLVEFLCGVEPVYKIHAGWTKWLGRAAMADRLPEEIVWRRDKMGWDIPENVWFRGLLGAWLERSLSASSFAREVARASGWLHLGGIPLSARLRLLSLAVWHKLFFEEPGRPGRPLGRGMLVESTPSS